MECGERGKLTVDSGNGQNLRGGVKQGSNSKAGEDAGRVLGGSWLDFSPPFLGQGKVICSCYCSWQLPLKSSRISLSGSFIPEFLEQLWFSIVCFAVRLHAHIFIRCCVWDIGFENVIHVLLISSLEYGVFPCVPVFLQGLMVGMFFIMRPKWWRAKWLLLLGKTNSDKGGSGAQNRCYGLGWERLESSEVK